MLQKRRKVLLHSQARIFAVRLRKYFCLEKRNKGPLLPVDRVCERVAAALRLTTESVVRITESKQKKKETKLRKENASTKKVKTLRIEPHLVLNCDNILNSANTHSETDLIDEHCSNTFEDKSHITEYSETKNEPQLQVLENNTIKVEYDNLKTESNHSTGANNFPDVFSTDNLQDEMEFKATSNKKNNNKNHLIYDKSGNFIIKDKSMATCRICFKTVVYRTRNSHFKTCHPLSDNRVMIKCELCNQSFIEQRLKWHIKLMHGKSSLKCAYCRSDFSSKDVLKDHVINCTKKKRQRVIRPEEIEIIRCDICEKQMQRASLSAHKNKIHFGLAPVCEHCGKTFGSRLRLMDHCRAKHGYEKLKCNRCNYQSSSQLSLENHIRKHDGIKPFVCDKCGVSFHSAYLLRQHRGSHTTEKAFKCEVCSAVFKSSNNLACHISTCHNVKQYSCSCGKIFSCQNYAKRHVKRQAIGKHLIEKRHTIEALLFDESLNKSV